MVQKRFDTLETPAILLPDLVESGRTGSWTFVVFEWKDPSPNWLLHVIALKTTCDSLSKDLSVNLAVFLETKLSPLSALPPPPGFL